MPDLFSTLPVGGAAVIGIVAITLFCSVARRFIRLIGGRD